MKLEIGAVGAQTLTDITSYIAEKGLKRSYNSLDADGAGRTLDGVMHRTQIGVKTKLDISCAPLKTSELNALSALLANEWLTVKLTTNTGTSTWTMYPGAGRTAGVVIADPQTGGKELWGGFSFSLIEK